MKPEIFDYTDYRSFLTDYYQQKKAANPSFSYNSFSIKAGFKNKSFIYNVIHGIKNISKSSAVMLSQAMGLKKMEAEYFENLVFFNQAKNLKEQNYFLEKLNSMNVKGKAFEALRLRGDQYEFYSKWYHSAIRSLLDMYSFKDDFDWLARAVYPPLTPKQAKASVELLENLGLIEKKGDGTYVITSQHITTGNESIKIAVLNYHRDTAQLVVNAIDTLPRNRSDISGLTIGISENAFHKIVEETKAFRSRIIELVNMDSESDRVYQFNLHLFPLSKPFIEDKKTSEKID